MGLDQTGIANNALQGLGEKVIQDVNATNDPRARKVKTIYDHSFRALARKHAWNCLQKRITLGPDTGNAPPFEWSTAYRLPSDFIKVVQWNGVNPGENPKSYSIEGIHILSNSDDGNLIYTAAITDPTIYVDAFVEAFIAFLQIPLAMAFPKDKVLSASKLQEFERYHLEPARAIDGNEKGKDTFDITRDSRWNRTRFNSTNG